jgi:hypothetical protein
MIKSTKQYDAEKQYIRYIEIDLATFVYARRRQEAGRRDSLMNACSVTASCREGLVIGLLS